MRGVFCLWELCSNSAQERARERRQGLRSERECVVSTAATGYGGRCATASAKVKLSQTLVLERRQSPGSESWQSSIECRQWSIDKQVIDKSSDRVGGKNALDHHRPNVIDKRYSQVNTFNYILIASHWPHPALPSSPCHNQRHNKLHNQRQPATSSDRTTSLPSQDPPAVHSPPTKLNRRPPLLANLFVSAFVTRRPPKVSTVVSKIQTVQLASTPVQSAWETGFIETKIRLCRSPDPLLQIICLSLAIAALSHPRWHPRDCNPLLNYRSITVAFSFQSCYIPRHPWQLQVSRAVGRSKH